MAGITGFAAGTQLTTADGEVRIERIRPGDFVSTADGGQQSVPAVSGRAFTAVALAQQAAMCPVRIAAGALAQGVPRRDLLTAPDQCVSVDGLVAPAASLVNGLTIQRDPGRHPIRYVRLVVPASVRAENVVCPTRSLALAGDVVAFRKMLDARAGLVPGPMDGNIAQCGRNGVSGWVIDLHAPLATISLEVRANGVVMAHALADLRRPDLEMAGLGAGRCGFAVQFRHPLAADRDHLLHVRRASDDTDIPGSPLILPRARGDRSTLAMPGATFAAEQLNRLLGLPA